MLDRSYLMTASMSEPEPLFSCGEETRQIETLDLSTLWFYDASLTSVNQETASPAWMPEACLMEDSRDAQVPASAR